MGLLYYWKDYRENTASGPIFKLNQKTPKLHEIGSGDYVWAIARSKPSCYVVAAEFRVQRTGLNPLSSPDYKRYGEYFFEADPAATRYFDISRQGSVEPSLRELSITTDATHLGLSFQGPNGVRVLSLNDQLRLSRYTAGLTLDRRLSRHSVAPLST
jgi:hypothetical protein